MKYLLLLLVSCGSLFGQSYVLAFTRTSTTGVSVPMRGASVNQFHQLTVIAYDKTAGSCSAGWTGVIYLRGSQDNTTYTPISLSITSVADNAIAYTSAAGSFAYVDVAYVSGSTSTCAISAWYSGTTSGFPTSSLSPASKSQIVGNSVLFSGQVAVTSTAAALASTGGITSAATTVSHLGTGYAVNDTGTITGGDGTATYSVTSVGTGGSVTGFSITNPGSGYAVATGATTTRTSGAGAGLELNILTIGFGVAQACVKADIANTINVYLGTSAVTTSTGLELGPDESVCLPFADLSIVYVVASTTGARVSWASTGN